MLIIKPDAHTQRERGKQAHHVMKNDDRNRNDEEQIKMKKKEELNKK